MLWAEGNAFKTITLTKKVISFEILKFYYKLISVESLKVSNFLRSVPIVMEIEVNL